MKIEENVIDANLGRHQRAFEFIPVEIRSDTKPKGDCRPLSSMEFLLHDPPPFLFLYLCIE